MRKNTTKCPAPLWEGGTLFASTAIGIEREKGVVLLIGSVALTFALHLLFQKNARRTEAPGAKKTSVKANNKDQLKKQRKEDFLKYAERDYGYRDSPCGYIDAWRKQEFPNLIAPFVSQTSRGDTRNKEVEEVYLDYAGAALPSLSLLNAIHSDAISSSSILANPHSSGPAAARTLRLIEETKKKILDHFQGHPGRFSTLAPSHSHSKSQIYSSGRHECNYLFHPGYEIVFTTGATQALRIVAEHFPWGSGNNASKKSVLLYSHNAHTSVVGMRGAVLAKGGTFICKSLKDIMQLGDSDVDLDKIISLWEQQVAGDNVAQTIDCVEELAASHSLLVIPAECNFGGDRVDARALLKRFRRSQKENFANKRNRTWSTMLDLAKASSTGAVNLNDLDPDFACVSFYKMFGAPTGLGALFVRRTATNLLANLPEARQTNPGSIHKYFGGGSVDVVLSGVDFAVERNMGPALLSQNVSSSSLASLIHGTMDFRGIVALKHGFHELERMGGMQQVQRHSESLAKELCRRLKSLRHADQKPAVVLYGAWGEQEPPSAGPVVAFNILRRDGTFVGYNEVAKLAALNEPPLQLRTGCFCNPGACQAALELTDQELIDNYTHSGHVCGDEVDIVNGKPVGAIRASFGKDSLWEDMDALVLFIENHFVNSVAPQKQVSATNDRPTKAFIAEIFIYPIKSCAGQTVAKWNICLPSGRLQFDREFALVDSFGNAMRLQRYPKMGHIRPEIDRDRRILRVSAPNMEDLVLKLDLGCENDDMTAVVDVCGNKCSGKVWGDTYVSEWFSSYLGVSCWLARYNNDVACALQESLKAPASLVDSNHSFANDEPILLISKHAVDNLNWVLRGQNQPPVSSKHFRPNLVVHCRDNPGAISLHHPEDSWKSVDIVGSKAKFVVSGLCARCTMVDVDPTTGTKGKTLRALAEYRRDHSDIHFGVFLRLSGVVAGPEHVAVGSQVACQ